MKCDIVGSEPQFVQRDISKLLNRFLSISDGTVASQHNANKICADTFLQQQLPRFLKSSILLFMLILVAIAGYASNQHSPVHDEDPIQNKLQK